MILIVNLNLAVDHIIEVSDLRAGLVHRALSTQRCAGGKGVNVARVLKVLGEQFIVNGFLGGRAGDFIANELRKEEINFSGTRIQQESRTCVILNDPVHQQQTVINEAGPKISQTELTAFVESYEQLLENSELVVITGSAMPSLPDDIYEKFIIGANKLKKPVLLDASSVTLSRALRARPFMVKINHVEASELLARSIEEVAETMLALDELIKLGAEHAMITLGRKGAVLAYQGVKYKLVPPPIKARNSVGSGDAVMGGLAAGVHCNYSGREMGNLAMAAGAANALHGGGHCTVEEISRFLPQVTCTIVDEC